MKYAFHHTCVFGLMAFVAAAPSLGAAALTPESQARTLWRGLPLSFEENQGQHSPDVRFSSRTADYRVQLTTDGARLQVGPHGETVRLSLLGANRDSIARGEDRTSAPVNYLVGARDRWRTEVASYAKVRYANVYPGADLVYYGNGHELEYDFVLRPGADPNRIALRFDGAGRVRLTPSGDVELEAGGLSLVQKKPVIYQQDPVTGRRRLIAGHYRLAADRTVRFVLDRYDHAQPVVIDPVLTYSSFVGGTSPDVITAAVVDPSGKLYVAGYTDSTDLLKVNNYSGDAYSNSYGGNRDIFIAKFDPTQSGASSLLYLTYIGGSGADQPEAMVRGADGALYLTGFTSSTNFPTTGPASQTSNGGKSDAFVLRFDPTQSGTGVLTYSDYLGGSGTDVGYGIAVDAKGAIYVTGATESSDFPATGSPYAGSQVGVRDAFVAKLDPTQSSARVYSTYLGGGNWDEGRGIAVGANGLVSVTGATLSYDFPMAGSSWNSSYQGGGDVFLAQLDLTQSGSAALVYSTFIGGSSDEEPRRLTTDAAGRLLLTGFTLSNNFPVTGGKAAQSVFGGMSDAFVMIFDPRVGGAGALIYSTFLGGADGEVGYDVTSDAAGNLYVAGYTLSSNFPVSTNALQKVYAGGIDGFVARINPAVSGAAGITYASYIGSDGLDVAYAVAVSPSGTMYVAGYTTASTFAVNSNAAEVGFAGGWEDGFVSVIAP